MNEDSLKNIKGKTALVGNEEFTITSATNRWVRLDGRGRISYLTSIFYDKLYKAEITLKK